MFLDNYVTEYKPPWKSDISSAEQIYLEPFLMHELEDILRGGGPLKRPLIHALIAVQKSSGMSDNRR